MPSAPKRTCKHPACLTTVRADDLGRAVLCEEHQKPEFHNDRLKAIALLRSIGLLAVKQAKELETLATRAECLNETIEFIHSDLEKIEALAVLEDFTNVMEVP